MSTITAQIFNGLASTTPRSKPAPVQDTPAPLTPRPIIVRLADVRPEPITWIWPGRLAAGKLALLVGDPGLGKSWITLDVAAHVSTGRTWPDGSAAPIPSHVLLMSGEDGVADTIRPRLDALGADVTRVHHLAVLRAGDQERAIQLADTDMVEQAIAETGARVLIIDPVSAYLGTTDSHRDAEVRGLMAPLALLAERTGVAILGVMHLCKSSQRPAIYRAVGSIAFAAAARIVLAVAPDPDRDGRRIVASIKSNLSAPSAALAYTLTDGRLAWEADPVSNVDVDALLAGPITPRDVAEMTDAEQVMLELFEDVAAWPMKARLALAAGEAHGVHPRTLQRTARKLGVRMMRTGFGRGGRWVWHRPTIDDSIGDTTPRTDTVSSMSSMAKQAHIDDNTHIDDTKSSFPRAREDDANDGRY